MSSGNTPVTITITGGGGQIGYALAFRIASGAMLGPDTPMKLRLLEIPWGIRAAEGAALELQDAAFPLLAGVEVTDDVEVAFDGVNHALLVGAMPRGPGMERADLLEANARIFGPQGSALAEYGASDLRVTVVGNPANTNALITAVRASGVPAERFSALTRLDHNRALGQLSEKLARPVSDISGLTVWGNHSPTMYPDVTHARVGDQPINELVSKQWLEEEFIPRVAKRGAEIIAVRGGSSVASAASAVIDHVHDWVHGTGERWVSVALMSHGEYDVPEGLVSSFPARSIDGQWQIVEGLTVDAFSRNKIDASIAELIEEREAVIALGLLP